MDDVWQTAHKLYVNEHGDRPVVVWRGRDDGSARDFRAVLTPHFTVEGTSGVSLVAEVRVGRDALGAPRWACADNPRYYIELALAAWLMNVPMSSEEV